MLKTQNVHYQNAIDIRLTEIDEEEDHSKIVMEANKKRLPSASRRGIMANSNALEPVKSKAQTSQSRSLPKYLPPEDYLSMTQNQNAYQPLQQQGKQNRYNSNPGRSQQ